jgi:hypothetical protein
VSLLLTNGCLRNSAELFNRELRNLGLIGVSEYVLGEEGQWRCQTDHHHREKGHKHQKEKTE